MSSLIDSSCLCVETTCAGSIEYIPKPLVLCISSYQDSLCCFGLQMCIQLVRRGYKFVCTDNTINVKIAIDAETMSRHQSRITLQNIRTAIYWACSGRIFFATKLIDKLKAYEAQQGALTLSIQTSWSWIAV